VNIESTLKEIQRVLKPGGTFVSWDPLAHNPVINIYRRLAFRVRTEDEHPLAMSDLKLFKKYFSSVEAQMTWFFTLWIFIKFFLIDGINPNKVRYWKKILADHKELEKTYLFLEKLDKIFLQIFPFMKRYCWNVTVIAKK
jgi:ubiquinone/menaquinone biosynthesis C-methylase UbiE